MGFQTLKQSKMSGVNYGDQNIEDDGHKAVSDSKTMLDGNIRH